MIEKRILKTYGPYLRKDGRKHVIHIYDDGSRYTQSYPRYLMEKHLGRKLLGSETVDHDDEDFTNDSIGNLKLLSLAENAKKTMIANDRLAKMSLLTCKECGKTFERRTAVEDRNRNVLGKDGPFCSHSCVGKQHH